MPAETRKASNPDDDAFLVVTRTIRIPRTEFEFTFTHSSGPGGQNVNKVATKARLRWNLAATAALPAGVRDRFERTYGSRLTNDGDLLLTSQRFRNRDRNARDCLERLREMLRAVAKPPTPRKPTKPSRGAVQRRIDAKKRRSQRKQQRRPPRRDD